MKDKNILPKEDSKIYIYIDQYGVVETTTQKYYIKE